MHITLLRAQTHQVPRRDSALRASQEHLNVKCAGKNYKQARKDPPRPHGTGAVSRSPLFGLALMKLGCACPRIVLICTRRRKRFMKP